MQISNVKSPTFNGCIAKTSTMDGNIRGIVENIKPYLRSNPAILDLAEELHLDLFFSQHNVACKTYLNLEFLDRISKKKFKNIKCSVQNNSLRNQKTFLEKIYDVLCEIQNKKIVRPGNNKKRSNPYLHLDKTLRTNERQDKKIYDDFFEKVDEVLIYEI